MTMSWTRTLAMFAVGCLLTTAATSVNGQEPWFRPNGLWPSKSVILRGQEPEGIEPRESENSDEEPIETDRDSFTPSTRTVSAQRTIIESSYSFIDNRHTADTHSLPELLVRYGLNDWLELRLGGNYEVGGGGSEVSGGAGEEEVHGNGIVRETQLLYGLKARISEQNNWLPESSLIVQGHTPASGPDPATAFSLVYVIGWTLPENWKLDSAIHYAADKEGNDRYEAWAPSIVLRKTIAERWNLHAEYFGHFSQDKKENFRRHYVSPGVHYLITPNVELGLRVGWGLNDDASKFFSNVGVGYRF